MFPCALGGPFERSFPAGLSPASLLSKRSYSSVISASQLMVEIISNAFHFVKHYFFQFSVTYTMEKLSYMTKG